MNIVPLSNNRIAITAHDDGKTALFTCRWKDGDVRPDELDRIADGCRLMAARLRGVRPFDDGVEMTDDEIESTFNAAAPHATDR